MDDQQRVQKFLEEFSERLVNKFRDDIDFILLFGSAARGEWKRGVSDVDLIIQIKNQEKVNQISKKAEEIFWFLDKKYKTRFKEVCSIGNTDDPLKRGLREARLYVPFEVFGPDDIDWANARIKKKELLVGAELIAPQAMLFLKMKEEGKILYGRDIRKEINIKTTWHEKIKALLVPFYIALLSVVVCIFSPKIALRMADKSVLYSIESFLYFLEKPVGRGIKKSFNEFEKEIKSLKRNVFNLIEIDLFLNFDYKKDAEFVKKAIKLKYDFQSEYRKLSRIEILKFCFRSFVFVNVVNWYAVVGADKYRIILKTIIILRTLFLLGLVILIVYCLNKFI